ncbi:serine--tRNA ligase [Pleomorphomonas diazotrophica]|uniref:Serine--tRNA ligase n=1 Tax=Pleomorphomonas diazotrophica TaxID=1166257 RepID=A0A1I4Q954_9HYPH|nr:serine--tRNA ligase [Pleomorphomonas diazotrophica]PKR90848.1 serine--tRNA ligase [Pleomorphomonas diazotrophica]SFM36628.1 seryl-tRNA synthetase [Pleomorphomonas diazotrophica]
MLDIKWIRDNPEALKHALMRRGQSADLAEATASEAIRLDDARRANIKSLQEAQERRNAASKEIGKAKATKDEARAAELMEEVARIKSFIQDGEAKERELDAALDAALSVIPNPPLDDVPDGPDESANVEHHRFGEPRQFNWAREHFELGEGLGMMDFERAAKLAGARFTVVKSHLARLERALGQFMINLHTIEHGYTEVIPPLMVRDEVMYGTGQLPKFAEDLFKTTDGRWLIPTAEVPLTNLVREEILEEKDLPLRFTALTPCFRSEAGSAGRDVRGMLRQHQFNKVELVSITAQEKSIDEHERMLACAEEVLKRLGLAYRVVTLCTGDMGFGSRKTYDIEVWLPGQKKFREISSCSVCGDFQGRRMNARYRPAGEPKGTRFVHTLNGSGVAVGRALIAVMETWQNEDGSVTVPDVLLPLMGGVARIEKL